MGIESKVLHMLQLPRSVLLEDCFVLLIEQKTPHLPNK